MSGIMFPESFHVVKMKGAELASIKTAMYKQYHYLQTILIGLSIEFGKI